MTRPRVLSVAADREVVISEAVKVLREGGVVAIPTETVYGIAVDASLPDATERIFEIKGRDRDKPLQLLAPSVEAVEAYGGLLSETERSLAEKFWPGGMTLVLRTSVQEPGPLFEGFRVPNHETVLALLKEMGGVLRATSANLSGEPAALSADDVVASLGTRVDLVLDDGPVTGGIPSTVVKVEDGEIKMLREGAISAAELERAIHEGQE